jgi:RNA polymerase sigma factor (sigma-70 family)
MNMQHIFGKPGKDWSAEEIDAVLEYVYHERLDTLVRIAFGLTHELGLAKDVVEEKVVELLGPRFAAKSYDPTRGRETRCPLAIFNIWLNRIIARAACKVAQRERGRRERRQRLQQQYQQAPRRSQPPPPLALVVENLWELVQPWWSHFSPKKQEGMILCWQEGLPYAEAACRVGCTTGAMKVRMHRVRHTLWALIQKEGGLL